MNVKKIVAKYLMENGFEGLCADECGCLLDDLIPCDDYMGHCEPGYKIPNPGGETDWITTTVKPKDINDESEDTRI